MANSKKIISDWSETGKTVYSIVRREADGYLLDDADGTFGAAPADPYLALAEHATIKGRYEVSEARTVWTDGRYTVAVYKQAGGSPGPASDTIVGTGEMWIKTDSEVAVDDYPNFKADVSALASQASVNAIPTTPLLAADYTAPDNAGIAALPTLAEIEASTVLAKQAKLDFVEKWILNKLTESPTGTWKLYDDDGVTVLKTWTWDRGTGTRSAAV